MLTLQEITKNVNWKKIGRRAKSYRKTKGLSEEELAEKCGISTGTITSLEAGSSFTTHNCLWALINAEQISINWLFTGKGLFDAPDPPELLPPAVVRKRGAGLRRDKKVDDAEAGTYDGELYEFVMAIDANKRGNKKNFLSWTEVYEIIRALGYRKTTRPMINPLNGVE